MLLEVKNLSVKYQNASTSCLKNINLDLKTREIVVISGASGSGKSTFVQFIAGLYPNDKCSLENGSIAYYNENIYDKQPYQKSLLVSLLFQNSCKQFCMRTLREEMQFVLGNLMFDELTIDKMINDIMHNFAIFDLMDIDFHSLSEGQKQLATLASIIVHKPRLIVLDEPFSHLDNISADKLLVDLHRLTRKENISLLVVDHVIERWLDVADRVLILNKNGELLETPINKSNYLDHRDVLLKNNILIPYKPIKRQYHEKNSEIILSLDNVSILKKKSDDILMYDVNINIPRNSIVAIYGKSGVGKTTLLENIFHNLEYEGNIYFDTKDLNSYSFKELFKRIRYILQNSDDSFMCERLIDEVVDVVRRLNPKMKLEDVALIGVEHLRTWNLYNDMRKSPWELSVGQRRRFNICLALLTKCDLLLVDEPTFGQDYTTTQAIMEDLVKLRNTKTTIIFTTHNLDVARKYADMLLCIENKKIKEVR